MALDHVSIVRTIPFCPSVDDPDTSTVAQYQMMNEPI